MEKLHGTLSATSATLHGILSARSVAGVEIYDGEYVVHSEAHEVQILPTANKQLTKILRLKKFRILKRRIFPTESRHT